MTAGELCQQRECPSDRAQVGADKVQATGGQSPAFHGALPTAPARGPILHPAPPMASSREPRCTPSALPAAQTGSGGLRFSPAGGSFPAPTPAPVPRAALGPLHLRDPSPPLPSTVLSTGMEPGTLWWHSLGRTALARRAVQGLSEGQGHRSIAGQMGQYCKQRPRWFFAGWV